MIFHIPHSSTLLPNQYRDQFVVDQEEIDRELLRMTDHFTDELFDMPDVPKVVFPISRLLVDAERFDDDSQESMAKIGMGVIYENGSELQRIKKAPSTELREELLDKYYWPHHQRLTELVQKELVEQGKALVIDCHSYCEVAFPYELHQSAQRPDICLGADDFHTSPSLVEEAREYFESCAYSVAVNEPFTGCLIPMEFYGKEKRVQGLMIEINRKLYMDETTGKKHEGFGKLKRDLEQFLETLH